MTGDVNGYRGVTPRIGDLCERMRNSVCLPWGIWGDLLLFVGSPDTEEGAILSYLGQLPDCAIYITYTDGISETD